MPSPLRLWLSLCLVVGTLGVGCQPASTAPQTPPPRPAPTPAPTPQTRTAAPIPPPSAPAEPPPGPPPEPDPGVHLASAGKRSVHGPRGLVTSVEEQATRAGVTMLEGGGNAVDAIVATAFALSVTHPSAGNLGGGGFMLVHFEGKVFALDFRETSPASLTQERFDTMIADGGGGPVAVGVPGTPAGLLMVHQRLGKLSRAAVLQPAITLAQTGYRLGLRQANTLRWNRRALLADPGLRRAFIGANNQPHGVGALLKRPRLAETLKRISEQGSSGFYAGPVAESIVRAMGSAGGIALGDLTGYEAKLREPLKLRYRGLDVVTMPPPSAGGVALAVLLGVLQRERAFEAPQDLGLGLHLFVEASRRAQVERRFSVVDPDTLSAEQQAAARARWLNAAATLEEQPIDREKASISEQLHPLYSAAVREAEHTTHLAAVDAQGNAVSLTTTLSAGFGAKLMTDTGIILNNSVASFSTAGANTPAPSQRTLSSMSPTLVYARGKLMLILGSPGGDTIPSTVAQVMLRLVDDGLLLEDAVDAPRVHHGFVPDAVRYEARRPLSRATLTQLRGRGHQLIASNIALGDANTIVLTADGAYGYADPREGGLTLAAQATAP